MKKSKIIALLLVVSIVVAFGLTGCQTSNDTQKVKVGFVYIGPIGDGGWTDAHNDGRLMLEKQLGVETIYKEIVAESAEAETTMRNMIDQGCNVIIATSYGYMDYVENVAKEYPNVKFLHCSGYKSSDNFSNYFGRIYQARYLTGIVAGMKTQTNKIGYVASFPIPEVVRGINAFTLGVKSVNPDATVNVVWTHTWIDPSKAKDAADALLEQDCDVLTQHQDAPGPQVAAEEKGVWAIGYDVDMNSAAPKANMTSAIWNWGPYYVDQVKAIMEGTWKSENVWYGMEGKDTDMVKIVDLYDTAPAGAKEKVEEMKAKIIDGSFKVFEGEIKNQNGEVVCPQGEILTDDKLLSMNWFVEGVVGNIE